MCEVERHSVTYVINETDSTLLQEAFKEKAVADDEQKHSLELDDQTVDFIKLVVCCRKVGPEI